MICHPRPLNVGVIKLPETNKTDQLENIIASMVLYKMGITGGHFIKSIFMYFSDLNVSVQQRDWHGAPARLP